MNYHNGIVRSLEDIIRNISDDVRSCQHYFLSDGREGEYDLLALRKYSAHIFEVKTYDNINARIKVYHQLERDYIFIKENCDREYIFFYFAYSNHPISKFKIEAIYNESGRIKESRSIEEDPREIKERTRFSKNLNIMLPLESQLDYSNYCWCMGQK